MRKVGNALEFFRLDVKAFGETITYRWKHRKTLRQRLVEDATRRLRRPEAEAKGRQIVARNVSPELLPPWSTAPTQPLSRRDDK